MGHICPRGLVGGLIKKGGGAWCICDARFRLVCSSAASWTGGCVGGCVCACALAVRGEVAGWPARCPGEQVVRSGRIWPWWLDLGLAGACCAELERLIWAKACLRSFQEPVMAKLSSVASFLWASPRYSQPQFMLLRRKL